MSARPYETRDEVPHTSPDEMMQHPSIEMLPPVQLKPCPRNARTHSKKQIRQIARSIERFGFTNPVLIDKRAQIIAGHGRVEAALHLRLARVPALRISHLSEVDKRAYILADNRLAEKAGWDREVLALELGELCELLTDEINITGFETGEVDLLLSDLDDTPDPADDVPAMASVAPVTRTGDLWRLAPHRLICGDARDAAPHARRMAGERAEMVGTEPRYTVPIQGHVLGRGARHGEFAFASGLKPVALVADAMKDCSRRKGLVLDPFMGSGTTIMAGEKVGRRVFGIECDPAYVDVAIRRQSWDTASKKGPENDWSVCTTWHVENGIYYLLDVERGRYDFPALRNRVLAQWQRWRPTRLLIDTAAGTGLIQDLGQHGCHAIAVKPERDKIARMAIQSGKFEAGQISLPARASWLPAFEAELFAFPGSKHDDQIDSVSQALGYQGSSYDNSRLSGSRKVRRRVWRNSR